MTEDNMSGVRLMIETDKRMTYQEIQTSLSIGMCQTLTDHEYKNHAETRSAGTKRRLIVRFRCHPLFPNIQHEALTRPREDGSAEVAGVGIAGVSCTSKKLAVGG
ncbi:hypothetical protein EVAR_48368_1 [Eumeta japonica]|uniref:Uncharacterized protein n=1 Tax=Eumeta variegata TaxID=151549 RepID=A0A4C1WMB7_EUMVA|nr:hypothetical protein EVAR_48368_1 [Eumeta japonica]